MVFKEKSYSCLVIEEAVNAGKWLSQTIYLLKDVVRSVVSIGCLAGGARYNVYPII
jgi:hypothetical protein